MSVGVKSNELPVETTPVLKFGKDFNKLGVAIELWSPIPYSVNPFYII